MKRNNGLRHYQLILPALAWVAVFTILPLLYLTYLSFFDIDLLSRNQNFVGLSNYSRFFDSQRTLNALGNTLIFTLVSVFISLILGIAAAWVFSFDLPLTRWLNRLFTLPLFAAPIAAGAVGLVLFRYYAPLAPPSFLTNPVQAPYAVVLVDVWRWTPLVFIVVLAVLRTIPSEAYEVARIETASSWAIFRTVTLPRLRPVLITLVLLRTIESLKLLEIPIIMTNGGPGTSTTTVGLESYRIGFQQLEFGGAAAIVVVFVILLIIVAAAFFWRMRQSLVMKL